MLDRAFSAVSSAVGEGVEIAFCCGDAAVAESFFDDLEVCSSGEQP
jgi:hypothetical protein